MARQQNWLEALNRLRDAPPEVVRSELRGLLALNLAFDEDARGQACRLLTDLHQIARPDQRARAAETLGRYAADLRRLMSP